ncbi:hypothetical protein P3S67_013898 [Capsicum chacoense]
MEIGLAVGSAVGGAFLNVFFDRLAPRVELLKMFQKHKHDDGLLEKLEDILLGLQIVLSDAVNKQASNPLVRKWLNKLQRAMDGTESLLEEVNYEALRLKVELQLRNLAETSNQQVSDHNLSLSDDYFLYIEEKLEDTIKKLEVLEKQIGRLGLQKHFDSGKKIETRTPSISLIDESDVFGRQNEIEELIDRLLSKDASEKVRLLSLLLEWGAWARQHLLKLLTMMRSLKGKRFLTVLDDMWNYDYNEWNDLRTPFVQGDMGSKIIVTTRKKDVAGMMGSGSVNVGTLSSEASWALFKLHSLENRDPKEHPELEEVGKQIADKCKGLPLPLKTLAGFLSSKSEVDEWTNALRSEIWELPRRPNAIFLETLLLSSCDDLEELSLQMEKLINLRHLDTSNTSLLKMPLHLSKLKSLQVLVGAKFLLDGWRMEDLGELHNFYGSLSILELQNVVDRREAQKANMRGMNHVEKLSLEWIASDADNSQTEREIFDELRPHTNIKELQISGYRGTQFPNWLADHSFLKLLVQLSLSNCKDCFSLPALGQLPCLKFLSIRGMHRSTEVTEEFYEFPALQNLSIEDCPKLTGKLPENLCSLSELRFSRCPELNLETPIQLSSLKWFEVEVSPKAGVVFDEAELFTSQHEGMKQIEKLYISDCNSLITLPTSTLPNTLKIILIARCRKFKLEVPVCCCNMFLDILTLDECDSIDDLSSIELVPRACTLLIMSCQTLTRFLIPNETEALDISCCENLEILSVACGTQMTSLNIFNCKKLKRLPERMQELLPSLEELTLSDCPEMESFPDGGLPFNLQLLTIDNCEKLVNCRKEWSLQRLPCLKSYGSNMMAVTTRLLVLPQIQSLLEQGLPSSISQLRLRSHIELRSLQTEGLGHLTSLQCLEICNCHQLQSLPETAVPSSLSELTIRDFSNLQSLPVKRMPSSLSKLYISFCPLLNPLLEFDKGDHAAQSVYGHSEANGFSSSFVKSDLVELFNRFALMMRAEKISMETLSIDDSWFLFKRHAFENIDPMEHLELVKVAKQIAAKCKGLPLALKTLAGMLRSESDIERWRRILRSEIWDLPNNDILPALITTG